MTKHKERIRVVSTLSSDLHALFTVNSFDSVKNSLIILTPSQMQTFFGVTFARANN